MVGDKERKENEEKEQKMVITIRTVV